jgi:predicted ABC-type sugar transport system permease subunit
MKSQRASMTKQVGAPTIAVLSNGLILLGVSDIWQFIIKGPHGVPSGAS